MRSGLDSQAGFQVGLLSIWRGRLFTPGECIRVYVGELTGSAWLGESGLAEYQSCGRVQIDVIYRYPFRLDTVQSPVRPEAPVASEAAVFPEITATPVGAFPAFLHCYYSFPISKVPCYQRASPIKLVKYIVPRSQTASG
jgi:hypothetical protein